MVEAKRRRKSQFEVLLVESRVFGVDIARLAVDKLRTPTEMQEFLDGFAASLNPFHDPQRNADALEQAKSRLMAQTNVARFYDDYLRWTKFLTVGTLSARPETPLLQSVAGPRQSNLGNSSPRRAP